MIPSFVLSLREGLEAALVLGIVLSVVTQLKQAQLKAAVWRGALTAAALAAVLAAGLSWIGMELEGKGEQIFEGLAMLLAGGLLTWMIFWMQRQGRNINARLTEQTHRAAAGQSGVGIFTLAFLAVFREGLELALFLVAAQMTSGPLLTLGGALLGIAAAGLTGWLLFASTRRLSLRRFFQVTNILLIFFAAGLIGLAVGELNEAGIIPTVVEHVYNLSGVLNTEGALGLTLKTLFGYSPAPSLTQMTAYLVYFITVGAAAISLRPRNLPLHNTAAAD